MSLYYFHVEDGTPHDDPPAVELPDLAEVRRQAERWFSDLLDDSGAPLADGGTMRVSVTDAAGHVCCSLEFQATGASTEEIRAYRRRAERAFPS